MLWFNLPRAVVCCVLTLAGGGAFAQVNASDNAFQRFYAQVTGVGKQTVGYGSGGQLVIGQGVPQISSDGGPVRVDRAVPIANNSGGIINANARVNVPPAVLGRIIRKGLIAVPVLGTGVALYDIALDLGFSVSNSGGTVSVSVTDPGAYQSSGSYWRTQSGTPRYEAWSVDKLCRQWAAGNGYTYVGSGSGSPGGSCQATMGGFNYGVSYTTITPPYSCPSGRWHLIGQTSCTTSPASAPSTLEAVEDAVAARSGWPSSSRISQAVADATALEPAEPFTATPQVTGPATSPGTTSTTENPDGSTTTTTTTYNHTYTGPTINTTTQTITSTCTGGSCNTTSTTETPKVDEQPFTMPCGVPGTPACAVSVDETGMPTADDLGTDGPKDAEEDYESWIQGIAAANPFPDINWAFELPTACGVIPTPAFVPFMESIDVCQWQPMFHELMTVVWMLGGLFGAISLFMRNSLAT